MKNLLVIEVSPAGDRSASRKLTKAIVQQIQAKYTGVNVKTRDLSVHPLPHLDPARLSAFRSEPTGHTENDNRAVKDSDEAIAELFAADAIVIAAPMWNFSIPSVLKSWIDHVVRAQKTFKYGAAGPEGLLKGKKLYLAVASGGVYSEGPAKEADFVVPYLRAVFGFIGLTDVSVFRAEGIAIPGIQETSLQKAIESIKID